MDEIKYEIEILNRETDYIISKNKKFNYEVMENNGKIKFGSEYVRGRCRTPNSWDHTYQKFDSIKLNSRCLIKVLEELNESYKHISFIDYIPFYE